MNNLQKHILIQNNSLIDSLLVKVIHSTYSFEFSKTTSKEEITDLLIEEKKIKFIITGDNQIYYISDNNEPKKCIEKDKNLFNDFAFFEVKNNIINNVNILETSPQAIIKTEVEKQDIQNITDTKKIDLKPVLSLKKDNINIKSLFDYKDVCILAIARVLLQNEIKVNDNEYRFDCFTNHKKNLTSKEKVKLRVFKDTQSFKCFDCGVKGNNVQLVIDVLNRDSTEAIKWIKENFQDSNLDSNSKAIPSGTLKQSEPITQIEYKGRVIDKKGWYNSKDNKYYRFIKKLEIKKDNGITQDVIDLIRSELNKSYSIKTFELLKEHIFIDSFNGYSYIFLKSGYENIVINNNDSKINIISEGLTDFLTAVELYKDNFKDYNFIQRDNKDKHFDFNLTDTNFFIIDSDDNETHIKKLIQESKQDITGKKFFTVEFKQDNIKDLSDYHFKMNFDSNRTKEYIEKNKKELVIIPHLPEPLPGDVTHKPKLEIFSKTDKDKVKVSIEKLFKYLSNCGFFIEMDINGDYEYYQKEGNFITNITKNKMIEFISNEVETQKAGYKEIYTDYKKKYFSSIMFFDTLPKFNFNDVLRDSKDVIQLTFNNCIVEITKNNIKIKKYTSEKILKADNKFNSINRNFDVNAFNSFTEIDYKNSIVYRFFENVTKNENKENDLKRFEMLQRIIGYYLHKFKNRGLALAYVLTDFNLSDVANGGSGKGLTCQFLNCYRNLEDVDNKNINTDNSRFIFEKVTKYNDIVSVNDLKFTFDIEILYNAITDNFTTEGKNKPKQVIDFEISPKIILTSNRPLKIEGGSSKRRFIEFEYSNYYNSDNKPNDDFNKQLMKDFNNSDWFNSDMFFIQCCQKYLQIGAVEKIENTFIDKNRFIEKYKMIGDVIEYLTDFFSNEFEYIQEIYKINQNIIRKEVNIYFIDIEVLNLHCKEIFKGSVNNNSIKQFSKFTEMITELNKINFNKNLEIVKKRFGLPSGGRTKEIYSYKVTDLELHKEISKMINPTKKIDDNQ